MIARASRHTPEMDHCSFMRLLHLDLRTSSTGYQPLCSLVALFTQPRRETVWKIGVGPESGLRGLPIGDEGGSIGRFLPPKRKGETPSAIFQTVSPKLFGKASGVGR